MGNPLSKPPVELKQAPESLSSLTTAIAKLKGWPLGAGIGAVLMAFYLWKRPERLDNLSPTLLFVIAVVLGAWLQAGLLKLSGWFANPLFRHLEATWEAKLENWRLRVVTRRGVISEADSRRLAASIAKRDIKGEAGPYDPPRRRNRSPKPPQPNRPQGRPGADSPGLIEPLPPRPSPGNAGPIPPESDV